MPLPSFGDINQILETTGETQVAAGADKVAASTDRARQSFSRFQENLSKTTERVNLLSRGLGAIGVSGITGLGTGQVYRNLAGEPEQVSAVSEALTSGVGLALQIGAAAVIGKTGGAIGGAIGGMMAGPIGSIVGFAIGGAVTELAFPLINKAGNAIANAWEDHFYEITDDWNSLSERKKKEINQELANQRREMLKVSDLELSERGKAIASLEIIRKQEEEYNEKARKELIDERIKSKDEMEAAVKEAQDQFKRDRPTFVTTSNLLADFVPGLTTQRRMETEFRNIRIEMERKLNAFLEPQRKSLDETLNNMNELYGN